MAAIGDIVIYHDPGFIDPNTQQVIAAPQDYPAIVSVDFGDGTFALIEFQQYGTSNVPGVVSEGTDNGQFSAKP